MAAERASTFSHRGVKVSVATTAAGPRLSVDGEDLVVISSNGAYRAVAFAFSPQPTLASLGRRVAENLDRIPGRF